MCGIFGLLASSKSKYSQEFLSNSFIRLANLSETRGKDSSGICTLDKNLNTINILKGPIPVQKIIKEDLFKESLSVAFRKNNYAKFAFGHSRLVTNGSQLSNINNQPISKNGLVAVHNGIIANVDDLWSQYSDIVKESEIDTEILLALIRKELSDQKTLKEAIVHSMNKIEGTVSLALTLNKLFTT